MVLTDCSMWAAAFHYSCPSMNTGTGVVQRALRIKMMEKTWMSTAVKTVLVMG
jgi:hypothetical protein